MSRISVQSTGYRFRLIFIWLSTPETAVRRVESRVEAGGHNVDSATVIRRYRRGLDNFFQLYQPIADNWRMYNNSTAGSPTLIAAGKKSRTTRVADRATWTQLTQEYGNGRT